MSMYELIKPEEIKMIEMYRKDHGPVEVGNPKGYCDTKHLLRIWEESKKTLFEKVFGGNSLIKEIPVKLDRPEREIRNDMARDRSPEFYETRMKFLEKLEDELGYTMRSTVEDVLLDNYALTSQKAYSSFSIPKKEGKECFRITMGTKIIRALKKINNEYNFITDEEMKAFEVKYSTFFNQKKLEGKLCLSIHPLDYITMSENDCDWESCMNWSWRGCYRAGTVEMMNSPYVVVGYLCSSTPMTLAGEEWNNKKWRCLFIVHPDILTCIKEYPYSNKELVNTCLDNLKVYNYDSEIMNYDDRTDIEEPTFGSTRYIFNIVNMYNDFYNGAKPIYYANDKGDCEININYSGQMECMWCGQEIRDLSDQSDVCCDICNDVPRCRYCDEPTPLDQMVEVEDGHVCRYCLEHHYSEDDFKPGIFTRTRWMEPIYFSRNGEFINNQDEYSLMTSELDNAKSLFQKIHTHWSGLHFVRLDEFIEGHGPADLPERIDVDKINSVIMV